MLDSVLPLQLLHMAGRPPGRPARDRTAALTERIRAVHAEWDATYGWPRITAELQATVSA
ncbi:IS3 family transposase [Streptomyces olivaceus]|uniref:IS3 family transposase n=1 Tax=Streptomyces olivaceus TaxID=47716 RepID=UPI0036B2E71C